MMSRSEFIQKWYSDCKEHYGDGFHFEPIDGPRITKIGTTSLDPMRLLKTRERFLSDR